MTDDQQETEEAYLRTNGWEKITQKLWFDTTLKCKYQCCHEVAMQVQQLRDRK